MKRLTQAELDIFLEKAADLLRGGVDHSEFRGYVFALLFYKRINDVYLENINALEKELADPELARDPRMHDFVVPDDCVWEKVARSTERELGAKLNDAMRSIERANEPKFDGVLANNTVDFNAQDRLPRAKLVQIINHFGKLPLDHSSVPDDLFGNAYEYLIRNFASKAGKSSGEFYTPKEVAYLMSEIVEPEPGNLICDWAAGSGGLLLQCRKYVESHFGKSQADRLFFYMQESNPSTSNIARINMFLHGVRGFNQAPPIDSLRTPFFREGQTRRLRQFDRIVMNPPFSLESWGYDDFIGGDPYDRFSFGMPPRENGDYAWMQHVVKSLKPTGRAIVVMSQGILFRGQPQQSEAEDGRNQKADIEYLIRQGLINADLIECIIVLPSKLFYGNNVPACLVVLNKHKAPKRKNKLLLVWASRNFENASPQNLLRRVDCMRVIVPWRAFGDLDACRNLMPTHEEALTKELERERDTALAEICDSYGASLKQLIAIRSEAVECQEFLTKQGAPKDKNEKKALREAKRAKSEKLKALKRSIKPLEKLETEVEVKRSAVQSSFERELKLLRDTADTMRKMCDDSNEAQRNFVVLDKKELEENEFNLNVPRYVDTAPPDTTLSLDSTLAAFVEVSAKLDSRRQDLVAILKASDARNCGGADA